MTTLWGRKPPAATTPAQLASARQDLKRALAVAEGYDRRSAELQAALGACDRDADAAAEQHIADCEPIQDELRRLEGETDAASDSQRRQARAALEAANVALAAAIETIDDRRKLLAAQLDEHVRSRGAQTVDAIRRQLVESAPVEILDRLFVLEQVARGSQERAAAYARESQVAAQRVKLNPAAAEPLEKYATAERRWRLAGEEFSRISAAALREAESLREQAIQAE